MKRHFVAAIILVSALQSQAALHELASLNKIYDYIAESEYDVRWFDEVEGFRSANRVQNLRFTYSDDGFTAEPRVFDEGAEIPWSYEIVLVGFGKDPERQNSSRGGMWKTERNKASVSKNEIEVQYINERAGMRQNFLVKQKPPGNQRLELKFRVQTQGLSFEAAGNAANFYAPDGSMVAQYKDLRAFDAIGAEIPAAMIQKNQEQFAIVVDDSNATYPILVDPLNVSVKVYNEGQSGAKFSYSVSRFEFSTEDGEVPGVLVGAPYFDTGLLANAGKVFAYYAFMALPSSPTWTKEGDQANCNFGWSVSCPGDVYGDSSSDVLVGAPNYDSGGYTDNGKVFLYNATSTGISSTAWTATPVSQSYAHAGYCVSGIGDMDHDGDHDFAVGAPDYDYSPSSDEGMVFVYKGTSTGPTLNSSFLGNGGSRRGFSISAVGDLNGDLYDEFIVGSPNHADPSLVRKGAIQIYWSNGTTHNTTTTILGQNASDQFGFAVAGCGDVNSDGAPDFLVGAPYFENGQSDEGKVYLFSGTSTTAYWTDESNQNNAHLGWSLAGDERYGLGDVSQDGVPDFVVGVPDFDDITYTNCGRARYYEGSGTPTYNTAVTGLFNNAQTGTSVAIIYSSYRKQGVAVGTPSGVNVSDAGGTLQIWEWQ